ncbi:heterokaryon incompatibility protein-domain-containing protein [Xylariaceae sp. FL1651]|nr:heterokaryon incompatibility protein-domain-containing protein [Xylariaceae sp. FL1651]
MAYRHRPLRHGGRTRLLILHPAESITTPIRGSLIEYVIGQSHHEDEIQGSSHYEALSYVWGPPSGVHGINIGSFILPITANCDAALRQLRCTSEDRVMWVDSICIDQTPEGIRERNTQVSLMGSIYEAATNVLIWLGEGDERTDALFLHLKRLYVLRDDSWEDSRAELNAQFMNELDAKYTSSQSAVAPQIIEDVLSRPWFERMWTLQELLLASHATVLCGAQAMEWDSFCQSLELVESSFAPSSKGSRNFINCYYACSDFKALDSAHNGILVVEKSREEAVLPRGLSTMMHHTRIRHATDPKDKVFALHGVSQRLGMPLPNPDYNESVRIVYARATTEIMRLEASLWPLDNVWSDSRRTDLPSWVPDWSADPRWSEDFLSELGCLPVDAGDREVVVHWDGPVDRQSPSTAVSADYSRLTLVGHIYDAIETTFNDQKRVDIQKDLATAHPFSVDYVLAMRRHGAEQVKLFRRIYTHLATQETPTNRLLQVFCRLLLTFSPTQPIRTFETGSDALHALFMATESSRAESHPILTAYATARLESVGDYNQRHPRVLAFVESDIDAALDVLLSSSLGGELYVSHADGSTSLKLFHMVASAVGFYRLVRGLAVNKTMFTSSRGLVGYAHGALHREDLIVKFRGASGPHVLRACGDKADQYQLCSPAVVKASCELENYLEGTDWQEFVLV